MNLKKFKALIFLGSHFFLHFVKKLLNIRQRHKNQFIDSYKNDHIFAISPNRRSEMPDYSRCIYCRLCDLKCSQLTANSKLLAPSYIVGSFSRSLPDYFYFNSSYDCGECQECEDICPQNIPIKNMITFIQEGKEKTTMRL